MGFKNSGLNGIPRSVKQPVSLVVGLTADFTGSGANVPIIYDTVVEDTSKGYDKSKGTFTAPDSGTYVSVVTGYITTGSVSNLTVAVNNVQKVYVAGINGGSTMWCGGAGVVAKRGDKISIQSQQNETHLGNAPFVNSWTLYKVN